MWRHLSPLLFALSPLFGLTVVAQTRTTPQTATPPGRIRTYSNPCPQDAATSVRCGIAGYPWGQSLTAIERKLHPPFYQVTHRGLRISHHLLNASPPELQHLLSHIVPANDRVQLLGLALHFLDGHLTGAVITIANDVPRGKPPAGSLWDPDTLVFDSSNHEPLLVAVRNQLRSQVPSLDERDTGVRGLTERFEAPGLTVTLWHNDKKDVKITILNESLQETLYLSGEYAQLSRPLASGKGYSFDEHCSPGKHVLTDSIAIGFHGVPWNSTQEAFIGHSLYSFRVEGSGLVLRGRDVSGACVLGVPVREIRASFNEWKEFDGLHIELATLSSYRDFLVLKSRAAKLLGLSESHSEYSDSTVKLTFDTPNVFVHLQLIEDEMLPAISLQHKYENSHPERANSDLRYGLAGIPFGVTLDQIKSILKTRTSTLEASRSVCTYGDTCIADEERTSVPERTRYLVPGDRGTEQLVIGYDFYYSNRDFRGEYSPRSTLVGGRIIAVNRTRDLHAEIKRHLDATFGTDNSTFIGGSTYWNVKGLYLRLSRDTNIQTSLNVADLRLIAFLDTYYPRGILRNRDWGIWIDGLYSTYVEESVVGLGEAFSRFHELWSSKFSAWKIKVIEGETRRVDGEEHVLFRKCIAGARSADECSNLLGRITNARDLDTANKCSLVLPGSEDDCRAYAREKLRIWNTRIAQVCRGQSTSTCVWLCPERDLLGCMSAPAISEEEKARRQFFIPLVHLPSLM